ncbi:hypothetical protein L5M11_09390 [Shewanella sp. SM87]|uniref:AbiTii domain-containing protein n=1 Tax=Shewanella sp. SM87 TaxID=2912808 RepID=UPI0021DA78E9|nr:hypothetical protein [Shewanella sp. SM87]MCU8007735.1 hypothetical protein [Shewanella sp. SM87]
MRSLVLELQHDCTNEQVSISTLIRKLVLIYNKLGLDATWAMCELHGYTRGNAPKYRFVEGEIVAKVSSQGAIPVMLDENFYPDVDKFMLTQAVGELEEAACYSTGLVDVILPAHLQKSLNEFLKIKYQFYYQIPVQQVKRVLSVIRSEVLSIAVKLEKEGILGEQMEFTKEEKFKAKANVTINIHGDMQGVVGDVVNSSLNQNLIFNKTNDVEQLTKFLSQNGIDKVDIESLIAAINADEAPKAVGSYGELVTSWYSKMIQKAADGSWQIGISTAAGVLTEALKLYYWK